MTQDNLDDSIKKLDAILHDIDKTFKRGAEIRKQVANETGLDTTNLAQYPAPHELPRSFQTITKEVISQVYAELKANNPGKKLPPNPFESQPKRANVGLSSRGKRI